MGSVVGAALLSSVVAVADTTVPELGAACSPDVADTMTLLPDEQTYAVCQESVAGYAWSAVQTPFEPHGSWLSYGPPITLHGQAMRNPNLSAGRWTGAPQDPAAVCRAVQQTVVEAGVLAAADVSEGQAGKELTVQLPRSLFYLELSGNCLWTKA